MKRLYIVCTLLLTLATPPLSAGGDQGQVLKVPDDFATIQAAVSAAGPGDTVFVAAGTYCGSVHINSTKTGLRLRAAPAVGEEGTILSACGGGGYGIHVMGADGVEISGFTIEGFESGIVLQTVKGARLHMNEVRGNVTTATSTTPFWARAQGIILNASSFTEVAQNWSHDNGHLGIGLFNGSHDNVVRGNRLTGNQTQQGATGVYASFFCSLMVWGAVPSTGNRISENEISGSLGYGLMISPGQTENIVAQNRVSGHPLPGIVAMSGAWGNLIQQNDARGNGTEEGADLWDWNSTTVNLWQRNLGTCAAGNAACQ